jgi:hypothetical protein
MINLGAELVHRVRDGGNLEGVAEQAETVGVLNLGSACGTESSAHLRIFGTHTHRVKQFRRDDGSPLYIEP